MDLTKFMYNDITPDMIDRFFNEGKELKQIDYDEFLKLPLNEPKSDEKINYKCVEETKDNDKKNDT